ncbi:MAG: adenosylcobinamide-phosphate synthase CbiB [Proteobacteria bacterium]|nr:adenosylcobinamide-phosphate synthase CbiB [Pseudomonadota bacterium]MBU1586070.1 adenosylcobinamide-phosphate synthase CbiB [Pseudomonadota bacterium]MBU2453230.1 adenosylcobinamide-phosphate synthase CbiB [Pseudomonadota bacterium]MBU2628319.1 adenosylcobinamide-phosphate synthase CbiB [Pseudomonadota bacterium]
MIEIQWYVILAAFILDFILGDPRHLPHPVIYMGKAIEFFEKKFRKYIKNLLISGFFFALSLIISTWLITGILIKLSMAIHPFLGILVQILLLFFCFSAASLEKAALSVFYALEENDIEKARKAVSMIVGRQTQALDQKGVTRASVETVAENFVDGFLSPLFFAVIGGVPLAVAYKMVNTLDSMVGYKNDTYLLFGRASARIDDVANFIPARISVLIITLSAFLMSFKKAVLALKTGVTQGSYHKSPNAGYPEAAFSGALEIRLGGPNMYHGKMVEKPFIGKEFKDPEKEKIKQACDLMMFGAFLSTLISCFIVFIF